ncbi:MAG: serine acetyltransferase [Bacteroidales bacterium]|jgi:lysophospholipase L1-like esterase|nr:serine acetyltransferase [Bacteroidales bacterium]
MKKIFVLALAFAVMATSVFAQTQKKYSDHYYKRTAQFEQERPINSNDFVMLGDSLTEGGDWATLFKEWLPEGISVVNRGIVGDDAPGIYDRLHQILPGNPKKIFLLVGVNDISHQITSDSVLVDIEKVVKEIVDKCPNTKLYIQSLLPYNYDKCIYKTMNKQDKTHTIRRVNKGLRKMARKYDLKYIYLYDYFKAPGSLHMDGQFTKDGLHINKAAYKIWANALKKYVE